MQKFFNFIMDKIGDLLTVIFEFIMDMLTDTVIAPLIESCQKTGEGLFVDMVKSAVDILQKSPGEWNSGGWAYIVGKVNTVFIIFGCQLVVLFFLLGFLSESLDPRMDIRLETFIKALFKILLAEYLVTNSVQIINIFFGFVGKLANNFMYSSPDFVEPWKLVDMYGNEITIATALENMNFGSYIISVIAALVYLLAMIGSGAIIAYTAYIRFFKIMCIVPYGALASSTVAGNRELSHTAVAFYKYVLAVVFEAVTIIIAVGLYDVINFNQSFEIIKVSSNEYTLIAPFLNKTIAVLLLVGTVKGAGALTQKALAV